MLTSLQPHPLRHWIPYKLLSTDEQLTLRWLYLADQPINSPFFGDTQQRCLSHPYNSQSKAVVSSLDGLIDMAQTVPSVAPSAFIFHVSRCGSTLLSQLLSLNERHIMLSEVPLLDSLLRLTDTIRQSSAHQQEQAFQAALRLLSHKRTGLETHVFIKTDSWHVLGYDTLRRLYPTTPFILLYRSPDAVLRSQQKQRGIQAVPGLISPEFMGFSPDQLTSMDLDSYMTKVLERYFEAFLAIAERDANYLLLNYQADGMAMMQELIRFLNLPVTKEDYAAMAQRCSYHGKYPGQSFQKESSQLNQPDYLSRALSLYQQVEEKRKQLSEMRTR